MFDNQESQRRFRSGDLKNLEQDRESCPKPLVRKTRSSPIKMNETALEIKGRFQPFATNDEEKAGGSIVYFCNGLGARFNTRRGV